MCVDPSTRALKRRFTLLLPGNGIERLYACPYDVAVSYAGRRWHPAARKVRWLLVIAAMLSRYSLCRRVFYE